MASNHYMMRIVAATLAIVATTSCGSKKDPGEFLGVDVTPDKAYIVPGSGKSCYDRMTTSGDNDPRSLSEHRIFYRNLRLQWRSTDNLTISIIRITVSSPMLKGGQSVTTFTEDEIESLTGGAGGVITGVEVEGQQKTIDSSDPARGDFIAEAACGLGVGGLAFVSQNPTPFTARVTVEVIGVAENPGSGEQSPVRQKTTATAEYY